MASGSCGRPGCPTSGERGRRASERLRGLAGELERHLAEGIIPFWEGLRDRERGGYYGLRDRDLRLHRDAVKGCILNSRILWFFSRAFLYFKEERLLEDAAHAYRFLRERFLDPEYGGVYWSVDCDGRAEDDGKHTYSHAFAVYGLSAYYEASGDREALALAEALAALMEERCRDGYGYLEAFDREWKPVGNEKLSENGVLAERTMNTLRHVMEAYTELYRVGRNPKVRGALEWILSLLEERVYNREEGRLEVFFDREWRSLLDLSSYGHDIEAAWLTDRTLSVLGEEGLAERLSPVTRNLTEQVYRRAYREHSLLNEKEGERVDTDRIWWVQAEAMVGFYNGFERQERRTDYLEAVLSIWEYVKGHILDPREGSEWFWGADETGKPLEKPMADPWKCPYHNGRMCLELLGRIKKS